MITVIGCDGGVLPAGAADAIARATLVVGAARHLSTVDGSAERVVLGDVAAGVRRLSTHDGPAVVLASGDPGFFGIVRALRGAGLAPTVLPAPSSVAHAFARLGLSWDDALVVSAHGRDPRRAVNACRAHRKVAVLTGPGAGPAELASALRGWPRRLLVCSRLGYADERVTGPDGDWADPNVVLVLASDADPGGAAIGEAAPGEAAPGGAGAGGAGAGDAARGVGAPGGAGPGDASAGWLAGSPPGPAGWALPETAFAYRDSMITKAEVRALVLARLGPRLGDLVWDVGAGSGSVAVEAARFGAAVIAVERDPHAVELVRGNASAHDVDVAVVAGTAPEALARLPAPDAVFVGGGGPAVLRACLDRAPVRIVAAFAALERVGPALDALTAASYRAGGSQVQANRIVALAGGTHRLAATNPSYVVWGERP